MCAMLLKCGARVNDLNEGKVSALHMAVFSICSDYSEDIGIIKLLIDAGAKVMIKDEDGNTPCDIATEFNRLDVLGLLKSG